MTRPAYILPALLFAQFAGTSPWFAGNAVIDDLQQNWGLAPESLAYVTSAVNLGFIFGTLVFALLMISDRYSPRLVFFFCTLAGATANFALLIAPQGLSGLLIPRFMTGFFLAGIYPVGMQIAAGWYREDLGRVLGFLIGALVLGTGDFDEAWIGYGCKGTASDVSFVMGVGVSLSTALIADLLV